MMRFTFSTAIKRIVPIMVLIAVHPAAVRGEGVSADLEELVRASGPGATIPVIIRLRDRVDASEIARESKRSRQDLRSRRGRLVRELKAQVGRRPYRELRKLLRERDGSRIRELWVINAVAAEVPAELVGELSSQPQVVSVRYDARLEEPTVSAAQSEAGGWNLEVVGAPQLWQLGWTGQGVVVAILDSGVDPFHPDLAPAWRGGDNSWFDPHGQNATPHDVSGHGTNVMGLILGGDNSGSTIGMAPGASWIAAKIYDNSGVATVSAIHASLQWLLDPDDDSETDDAPDVVNNSWNLLNSVGECDVEFQDDLEALRAAEIVVVFAAGNSGPNVSTSMSPANNPPVGFAVGSVDQSLTIDSNSARGPSACTGSVYPHVVAPGVNVESTGLTIGGLFPDSYEFVSGTSFAAPHVAGAFALLKSAVPGATLDELETAMEETTLDLGAPGPDNHYGAGLIDVVDAHLSLSAGGGPLPVPALSGPGMVLLAGLLVGRFRRRLGGARVIDSRARYSGISVVVLGCSTAASGRPES
jgi:serine protease AprX